MSAKLIRFRVHFADGVTIFSNTLTDEATAIRRNAPYAKPSRFLPPPEVEETDPATDLSEVRIDGESSGWINPDDVEEYP